MLNNLPIKKMVTGVGVALSISIISACGSSSDGNSNQAKNIDTQPPTITLIGDHHITVIKGREYDDSGATAIDNVDGPVSVTQTGTVNTSQTGEYTITYTATDLSDNQGAVTRTVTVREALPFVTTWKTDNAGYTEDNQIKISVTTSDQNYSIDWGDGTQNNEVTGDIIHTYNEAGTYTVSISGDFKNIQFGSTAETDTLKILSVEQWGDTQWSTMVAAFASCKNLILNATDSPDLSNVTSMMGMFAETKAFNGSLSHWDVSSITDLSYMFYNNIAFNEDLSQWDVSSVNNMSHMFTMAKRFNQDIGQWNVSSVTDMSNLFAGAENFNQDLGDWNTSSVTDMSGMFTYTKAFNRDINQWDVTSVTNMKYMFDTAEAFNQDISPWDVSSVTDMSHMFRAAESFNQPIGSWDVSAVTNMSEMFQASKAFNGDISQWNVSSVTNMSNMFSGATSFNGKVDQWDISSVQLNYHMFFGVTLPTDQYDAILKGWSTKNLNTGLRFHGGESQYSPDAEAARSVLINTYGWIIEDGGLVNESEEI